MTDYKPTKFHIIRYAGQRDEATTSDGIKVYRKDKVWVADMERGTGRFIACAPDDTNFIFVDPNWTKVVGRWFAYCSCGSPAVIVGSNAYKQYGSYSTEGTIKGELLICKEFLETAKHYPINWRER